MKFLILFILFYSTYARSESPIDTSALTDNFSSISNLSISNDSSLKNSFAIDTQVNPNRGVFKTGFSIPLGANRTSYSKIFFNYNSSDSLNRAYGIGFSSDLPLISKERRNNALGTLRLSGFYGSELFVKDTNATIYGQKRLTYHSIECNKPVQYLPVQEGSFSVLLSCSGKDILLTNHDETLVFSKKGLLEKIITGTETTLEFYYNDGVLQKVINPLQSWSVEFDYSSEKSVKYLYGDFREIPHYLKKIRYLNKGIQEKEIIFEYDKQYLVNVSWKSSILSLFNASYESYKTVVEETSSEDKKGKNGYQLNPENGLQWYDTNENPQDIVYFIDLNNDQHDDKIVFHFKEMNKKIYEIQKDREELENYLKSQRPSVSVYLAVNKNGRFEWERSSSLEAVFEGQRVSPAYFYIKDLKDEAYQVIARNNGLNFLDINSDGLKDLVFCPRVDFDNKIEDENKGNLLVKGLYNKYFNSTDHKYDKFLSSNGQRAQIYELIVDNGAYKLKRSNLTVHCHQYSQFVDVNNDGFVDVINGNSVELLGHDSSKIVYNFDLLPKLENESVDISKDNVQLVDYGNKGNLSFKNVDSVNNLAFSGEVELHSGDKLFLWTRAPYYKVMSKVELPLGGEILIKYKNKKGIFVVESIVKSAAVNSTQSEKTIYDYKDSELYNVETGEFNGFNDVYVHTTPNDKHLSESLVKYEYFPDFKNANITLMNRPQLPGLLLSKSVLNPHNGKVESAEEYEWSAKKLENGRILLFKKRTLRSAYLRSGKVSRETTTKISCLDNEMLCRQMSIEKITEEAQEIQEFDNPQGFYNKSVETFNSDSNMNFRVKLLDESYGKKNESEVVKYEILAFDDFYRPTVISNGIYKTNLTYKNDRLVKSQTSRGGQVEVQYHEGTKLLRDVTVNGVTYQLSYDSLWSRLVSKQVRTMNYQYFYNNENMIDRVILNDSEIYSMGLDESEKGEGYEVTKTIRGIHYTQQLDGFGNVVHMTKASGDEIFDYGKNELSLSGKVLKQYYPESGRARYFKENYYDNHGELVKVTDEHDKSNELFINRASRLEKAVWSMNDGDVVVNNRSHSGLYEKTLLDGNLSIQMEKGEEFFFSYDHNSNVQKIEGSELSSEWSFNHLGELESFSWIGEDNATYSIQTSSNDDHYTKSIVSNNSVYGQNATAQQFNYQFGSQLDSYVADDISIKNRFNKGMLLLSSITLKDSSTFSIAYGYNTNEQMNSVQTDGLSLSLDYDSLGFLKKVKSNRLSFLYQYNGEEISAITPLVNKVNRDSFGNITGIYFNSGIEFGIRYKDGGISPLMNRIMVKDQSGKSVFKEYYSYLERSNKLGSISTSVSVNGNLEKNIANFDYQNGRLNPKTNESFKRNEYGNVVYLGKDSFSYLNNQLVRLNGTDEDVSFSYNASGMLIFSKNTEGDTFKVIDRDHVIINDKAVSLLRLEGQAIAVLYEGKAYPVLTDWRGSVRVMFNEKGELLWKREYSSWGEKSVQYNHKYSLEAQKLENLTVWSFAGLFENPLVKSKGYYWSQGRVYNSKLQAWMSLDPTFISNPKSLIGKRGNWVPYRYCDNDPVNFVDPSGLSVESFVERFKYNFKTTSFMFGVGFSTLGNLLGLPPTAPIDILIGGGIVGGEAGSRVSKLVATFGSSQIPLATQQAAAAEFVLISAIYTVAVTTAFEFGVAVGSFLEALPELFSSESSTDSFISDFEFLQQSYFGDDFKLKVDFGTNNNHDNNSGGTLYGVSPMITSKV